MSGQIKYSLGTCPSLTYLFVWSQGGQQGDVWDVRGGSRTSGQDPGGRHPSETLHQQAVLLFCHRGRFERHPHAGKDHQPYTLKLHSALKTNKNLWREKQPTHKTHFFTVFLITYSSCRCWNQSCDRRLI